MSTIPPSLRDFADRYTAAWCSRNPQRVADHYAPAGSLRINGGNPAVGRPAISEVANSFMIAFPDLEVRMDRLASNSDIIEYHWTLRGANTGPGGSGRHVRISGLEEWRIGSDGLIAESNGHFDAALFQHQLEHGVLE